MNQPFEPEMSHSDQNVASRSVSSESEARQPSSGLGKKRASRAGTRKVNSLSAAQLDRKRQNDREAQRAIRQRTKEQIDTLNARITHLTSLHDDQERAMRAVQRRNGELEAENGYLKSRIDDEGVSMGVTGSGVRPSDQNTVAPGRRPSPRPKFSGVNIARAPTTRSHSFGTSQGPSQHADAWRHQPSYSPSESRSSSVPDQAPNATIITTGTWRGPQDLPSTFPIPAGPPQYPIEQPGRGYPPPLDRSHWHGQGPEYGYYQGQAPQMSFQHQSRLPSHSTLHPQVLPSSQAAYNAQVMAPTAEFHNLSVERSPSHSQPTTPGLAEHHPPQPGYPARAGQGSDYTRDAGMRQEQFMPTQYEQHPDHGARPISPHHNPATTYSAEPSQPHYAYGNYPHG